MSSHRLAVALITDGPMRSMRSSAYASSWWLRTAVTFGNRRHSASHSAADVGGAK